MDVLVILLAITVVIWLGKRLPVIRVGAGLRIGPQVTYGSLSLRSAVSRRNSVACPKVSPMGCDASWAW